MNEDFSKRLDKAMKLRNIKATELSEKANIPKSAISQYLSGLYEAKQKSIFKLAKVLNVSEAWLMGLDVPMEKDEIEYVTAEQWDDLSTDYVKVKDRYGNIVYKTKSKSAIVFIYGSIPAGIPMECIEDILDKEEIPIEWLKGDKKYFGLRINGNSMFPEYLSGDTIILEKVDDCESGQDCVVMVNGNDGTFKRVFKNENGIILQPLNSEYQPIIYTNEQIENLPVRIIGKVVELRRKK